MSRKLLGHLRKLALLGAMGVAGWTWVDTLKWSWASKEWTGLWSSAPELRGTTVKIAERDIEMVRNIETPEERERREKREMQLTTGLVDELRGVKRDVVGDKHKLRGKDVTAPEQLLPPGYEDFTQRDVCMQQKLEFPERFKDIDCMSDRYDNEEPWFRAPTQPGSIDTP